MHIEFLVEEPSAEAALNNLIPQIVGRNVTFAVHAHQGKRSLLQNLSNRLRGYSNWLPDDWRIVVLIDEDRQDCRQLKSELDGCARDAGLIAKSAIARARGVSTRPGPSFHVLNRLAIEELEAWFFGDVPAITAAYPRVSRNLGNRKPYRDPDAIGGGTWEALERELQRAGYHRGGLAKILAAREISTHMDPGRNVSRSFQVFRKGLLELIGQRL